MRYITLSLTMLRRWQHPQNWMVNSYSQSQDLYYFYDSVKGIDLPAGGWTLKASDLLRIIWDGPVDKDCEYQIVHNTDRIYRGLWTPKIQETVTESFFRDGDLLVLHYRLLRVKEITQ